MARRARPAARPLFTIEEKRRYPLLLGSTVALLFLADAARRVAGTCPAGPPDLYRRATPEVALVAKEAGLGRFYDDGADDAATVARRTREAGGLDLLRPATGVVFGIRYAGENDVDRMTPAASVRFARETAGLGWGEEKIARLRRLGVVVVRTPAPPPDPVGVIEIARFGGDRIVRVERPREEFTLLPAGGGRVTVRERGANLARLEVHVALPVAVLAVSRTFDPNWRARLDGNELALRPIDGFLTAATCRREATRSCCGTRTPPSRRGGAVPRLAPGRRSARAAGEPP